MHNNKTNSMVIKRCNTQPIIHVEYQMSKRKINKGEQGCPEGEGGAWRSLESNFVHFYKSLKNSYAELKVNEFGLLSSCPNNCAQGAGVIGTPFFVEGWRCGIRSFC